MEENPDPPPGPSPNPLEKVSSHPGSEPEMFVMELDRAGRTPAPLDADRRQTAEPQEVVVEQLLASTQLAEAPEKEPSVAEKELQPAIEEMASTGDEPEPMNPTPDGADKTEKQSAEAAEGEEAAEQQQPSPSTEWEDIDTDSIIHVTEPICPAKVADGSYCQLLSTIACPKCFLIAYCSEDCRRAHWNDHSPDCVVRQRALDFQLPEQGEEAAWKDAEFWAKYAAIDVLYLEKNEGKDFDGIIDILLAGGSSLRHLLKTIGDLPDEANPHLRFALNEKSMRATAGLVLSLILLTETSCEPEVNAEAVVHLWYSAKLPANIMDHIQKVAVQSILACATDVARLAAKGSVPKHDSFPIAITRGNLVLTIELSVAQWETLVRWVQVSENITEEDAQVIRVLDRKYCEPLETILRRMTPARAAGLLKWRTDGILLPYGVPRDEFTVLNPLFFKDDHAYPPGATAEPLTEWPIDLFDHDCGPAQNDTYGKMFYYVRSLCIKFQSRIQPLRMNCIIMNKAIKDIPMYFNRMGMNRQAGDLFDTLPLLTVAILGHLLQHQDENPNATLLTATRKSVDHQLNSVQKDLAKEKALLWQNSGTKLDELAPPLEPGESEDSPKAVRRMIGLLMWRSWDKFSEHYLNETHHFKILSDIAESEQTVKGITAVGFAGLEFKQKNTVTRRWPYCLVHSPKDAPSLKDFNRWLGWGDNKPERWLEWKKVDDPPLHLLALWHELGLTEVEAQRGGYMDVFNWPNCITHVCAKHFRLHMRQVKEEGGQIEAAPQFLAQLEKWAESDKQMAPPEAEKVKEKAASDSKMLKEKAAGWSMDNTACTAVTHATDGFLRWPHAGSATSHAAGRLSLLVRNILEGVAVAMRIIHLYRGLQD
ncbi:hypothetical protein ACJZ2D_007724 [Fusarium nematophilum]